MVLNRAITKNEFLSFSFAVDPIEMTEGEDEEDEDELNASDGSLF